MRTPEAHDLENGLPRGCRHRIRHSRDPNLIDTTQAQIDASISLERGLGNRGAELPVVSIGQGRTRKRSSIHFLSNAMSS